MTRFTESLSAWGTESFSPTLKREIEELPPGTLPLQQGTTQGGVVDESALSTTVINTTDGKDGIEARVGVFFSEIVGGCSCGDDPLTENAYCELSVTIDRATAETRFTLFQE